MQNKFKRVRLTAIKARERTDILHKLTKNSGKIILALLAVVLVLFSVMDLDAYADGKQRSAREGFFEYSGYHEIDSESKRLGYGEDFFRLLQRYTNLHYEYVDIKSSWDELFFMLENGDIDAVSPVRWTPERAQRFDFSHNIGRNYAQITARKDDYRFDVHNNDYSSLNGARIGVIKNSGRILDLQRLAKDYNFTYIAVPYSNEVELTQALQNGDVDLVETSSLRKTKNERIIAKFAPEEFFVIVRKGDKQLLNELNYGIEQMDINEGDWRNILFYKNYLAPNNKTLAFSQRELEYIEDVKAGRKKIVATVRTDLNPFAYTENGTIQGIIPEYFAYLMQMAGLPYTVAVPKSNTEYMQWLREGRADVFMSNFANEAEQNSYGVATESYMRLNISRVTRKNFTGKITSIATLPVNKNKRFEGDLPANLKIVEKPTREDMMRAVCNGEADACYVYSYVVDKFIRQHPDCNLVYTALTNPVDQFQVIVSPNADHELASIINKCIKVDNGHQVDELVKKHMEYTADGFSLKKLLLDNPLYIFIVVLTLVAAVYIFYLNTVMRKNAQQLAAERLQYAERLQKQNRQLEASMAAEQRANMAKRQFLFNMSHDIRTPMNAILGFTDLAAHSLENKVKLQDYLQKIRRSGDNLLALINNVLEMSRIETGKQQVNEELCDAEELIKSIIVSFEADVRAKNLSFTVERRFVHKKLWLDPTLIRQIVVNLISNAIKYTPEGGRILYQIEELPAAREGYCQIKAIVKDNGIGISKEFLPHIFEQFEREQTETATKIEGSGLGMAIVKRTMDLLGADIQLESEPGKGTTVTCLFEHRYAADEEDGQQDTEKHISVEQLAGKHILLAEDNDLNAEIAMTVLQNIGLTVDRAVDGEQCLQLLEAASAHTYDLILMDVQMPKMNGYEAARSIRALADAEKRAVPIVAMTANAFAEDRQKALEAGMNDFMPKPVDVPKLLALLAKLLHK